MTTEQTLRYLDLERFLNITAKSGYVNVKEVITEMAKLLGLDPVKTINPLRTV